MNFFAHGRLFLDAPYFLAGTAVPDWLNVVDRRVRARRKRSLALVDDEDPRVASVARGIVRHHDDDARFHTTQAFTELSMQFSKCCAEVLADRDGMRPSFLGHILVELLLDATLIARQPTELDEYYRALDRFDPAVIAEVVNRISTRPTGQLAVWIGRFSAERFLYDYAEDAKLLVRLNQVMRRVKLPLLPEAFVEILPDARRAVDERADELLGDDSLNGDGRR
jgi:hypothetical protein